MEMNDLSVRPLSTSLKNIELDIIVTGSIAAVESVRFVRSLRRLGANVHVWLTRGGSQFITADSLAWASSNPVTTDFDPLRSHIAQKDGCLIIPASAQFISKIKGGVCDNASSTLAASYLGSTKPVFILPTMHESMKNSPAIDKNIHAIKEKAFILEARTEEGKVKFPDPIELADQISHFLNKNNKKVLVTMGSTKAYIDPVRYVSNYSSGALGSEIVHEYYRRGFETTACVGNCEIRPHIKYLKYNTNEELKELLLTHKNYDIGVMCAAVSDFSPANTYDDKLTSKKSIEVSFSPTEKLISYMKTTRKIGFKYDLDRSEETGHEYLEKYNLDCIVLNKKDDVSETNHSAQILDKKGLNIEVNGKHGVAHKIVSLSIEW